MSILPSMTSEEDLRKKIKRKISRAGMTQKIYAEKRGYSEQYLSDFLSGKRHPGKLILEGEGLKMVMFYVEEV